MSDDVAGLRDLQGWLAARPYRVGPFVRIPRPEIVEIAALAGFDLVVVDLEHGAIQPPELGPMILAAERRGIALFARLPAAAEPWCKWLLDLGVHGLQVPHVSSRSNAEAVVRWSRFAPVGERGLCRFVRAADYSATAKEDYLSGAEQRSLVILQVEGRAGLAALDDILAVAGVDVIFLGPYDISQSLGVPGDIWHEAVVAAISGAIERCRSAGVAVGIFAETPDAVRHWTSLGVTYVNYRVEVEMILSAWRGFREALP